MKKLKIKGIINRNFLLINEKIPINIPRSAFLESVNIRKKAVNGINMVGINFT